MGFGKAFLLSLVIFIAINFGIALVIALLGDGISSFFDSLTDMEQLGANLFGTIKGTPYEGMKNLLVNSLSLAQESESDPILPLIAFIAAPLVAAIIAGVSAEGKGQAFGAWFLVAMIAAGVILVLEVFLNETMRDLVLGLDTLDMISYILLNYLLAALVNGFFYGCFALLTCKSEFY